MQGPVSFSGILVKMLTTAGMSVFWHPLDLGKCQLHLRMESNRFITPFIVLQTTRREDYSSLGEDVDEKLSIWSNNRQYNMRQHEVYRRCS